MRGFRSGQFPEAIFPRFHIKQSWGPNVHAYEHISNGKQMSSVFCSVDFPPNILFPSIDIVSIIQDWQSFPSLCLAQGSMTWSIVRNIS